MRVRKGSTGTGLCDGLFAERQSIWKACRCDEHGQEMLSLITVITPRVVLLYLSERKAVGKVELPLSRSLRDRIIKDNS